MTPSALEKFNKGFEPIVWGVMYIGAVILFLFAAFIFLDVLLRYVFSSPLPYSKDLSEIILVVLCFFGIAFTQLRKQHIVVDLVTDRLSRKAALSLSIAMYVLCACVTGVLSWQSILNAIHYYKVGIVSYGGLPLFPATIVMCLGSVLVFIIFIRDILSKIIEGMKLEFGVQRWLITFVSTGIFIGLVLLMINQVIMPITPVMMGLISIFLLFGLIFLGMPVCFAIFFTAVLVMGYSAGPIPAFRVVGPTLFRQIASYSWSVVPLYILMSYFIMASGLGTAAFYGVYKWIGHWRGGLGIATVGGSGALAAVVGIGVAAIVTMGLVALPEMRRYKYADSLATGAVAAGATLGPIIPPSLPFIVFGIITGVSIGNLFIAGIVPGILLGLSFIIYISIRCRLNPDMGPAAQKATWSERWKALPVFGPILALFLLILGGIYAGAFTAIEGGGIGAFMAFVIAFAMKKLSLEKIKEALVNSMAFVGMVFPVIAGSMVLSNSWGNCGLSSLITKASSIFFGTPIVLIIIILFIYMIFGLACDAPTILMLTLPIIYPIVDSAGIDLVWFGVVSSMVVGLGEITPPYAMGIFTLRSLACPDIPLVTMFKGIIPFCICTVIVIAMLLIWPDLVLFHF